MTVQEFVETWKRIAMVMGRSERWCRDKFRRREDPLPVHKIGGIIRLNISDLETWLARQQDNKPERAEVCQSIGCGKPRNRAMCIEALNIRVIVCVRCARLVHEFNIKLITHPCETPGCLGIGYRCDNPSHLVD